MQTRSGGGSHVTFVVKGGVFRLKVAFSEGCATVNLLILLTGFRQILFHALHVRMKLG